MSTPTIDRAQRLVDQLVALDVRATTDAAAVMTNLPCVLVGPPSLVLRQRMTATWRLLVIASTPNPLDAWGQLDALVTELFEALPVETAEPTSWALAAGTDPLPAYVLTMTDTL